MKRLHVIQHKSINDVGLEYKGTVVSLLEEETLNWAKEHKKDAYALTVPIQLQYEKNPNNLDVANKYFKYLRRLYELKLEFLEEIVGRTPNAKAPEVNKDLQIRLSIETLRMLDFISCSQIQMYETCPRKFYWRYVKGIKFPKTHALHFGTAVDNTFNVYFEKKIKGEIMPRTAVHAQFFEEFEKGRDEVNWEGQDPKRFLKIGPKVIDAYLDRFDPITKATDVQTECIIHLDNGGRLVGYIDILESKVIVDTKTAAKPWETTGRYAKHLQEIQPKAYSLWYLETYEEMPGFRYQIVTKPEDENGTPQTQLIEVELKKFELEAFRRYIQKIWDSIQEAIPKGKAGFPAEAEKDKPKALCCMTWCEYGGICRNDGLRVPLRWVSKTATVPGHHIYEEPK